ncbi:tyrosine-protein kinase receptor ver-4-like, partial [Augochlora pura]
MYKSILRIRNVKIEDSGLYVCMGKSTDNLTSSSDYRLEVKAGRAPIITDTNLKENETIIDITAPRRRVDFRCIVDGVPQPDISWYK